MANRSNKTPHSFDLRVHHDPRDWMLDYSFETVHGYVADGGMARGIGNQVIYLLYIGDMYYCIKNEPLPKTL